MIAYVALIISLFSLVVSSPRIARFLIYFLYKSKLDIFFQPPNGRSEILADPAHLPALEIRNKDTKHDIWIEPDFVVSKPVEARPFMQSRTTETNKLRGRPKGSGFAFRVKPFYLSREGWVLWGFPFEPYPEEYTLEIIVYVKMKMSEFGLPTFFGEVNLNPVKKLFTIKTLIA